MSEEHDRMIEDACRWAEALGYEVLEKNPGNVTGPDAIFRNYFSGAKVMLEVVTGASFKELFRKPRIKKALQRPGTYWIPPEIVALIVVGDRVKNVKDHGVKAGLSEELFDPPKKKVFAVRQRDFERLIPLLLVSLLGSRASAYSQKHWVK